MQSRMVYTDMGVRLYVRGYVFVGPMVLYKVVDSTGRHNDQAYLIVGPVVWWRWLQPQLLFAVFAMVVFAHILVRLDG